MTLINWLNNAILKSEIKAIEKYLTAYEKTFGYIDAYVSDTLKPIREKLLLLEEKLKAGTH